MFVNDLSTLEPGQTLQSMSGRVLHFLSLIQSLAKHAAYPHVRQAQATQNFMEWGLSFLVREKRALRYFLTRGFFLSALMFARMAPSTAFWVATLSAVAVFFLAPSAKKVAASAALVLASLVKVLSETLDTSTPLRSTFALVVRV